MIDFLFLFTFILLCASFLKLFFLIFKKFKQGYFSVAMPLVLVMVIFLLIPIILDLIFGKPDFNRYKGFSNASESINVDIYYNVYIIFVNLLFIRYMRRSVNRKISFQAHYFFKQAYKSRMLLWFLMFLPIIAVLLSSNPLEYLNYKAVVTNRTDVFRNSHVFVGKAALLSVAVGSILFYLIIRTRNSTLSLPRYVLYFILIFIAFWVDGKRGIIVKYLFLLLASGWILGKITPKKIVKRGIIGIALLVVFVGAYGKDFAKSSAMDRTIYSSFRLNLGRDHTIKYTLYKEFEIEKPILEFRGQSFLFDVVFFIPRSLWPQKPYPYAVYFVTDVLSLDREPIGWTFTTCILEEFISNFGFIGMFLAPLFLLWICKIGDNTSNIMLTFFSILVAVFFMFTQLAAFMPIFMLFIFMFMRDKIKRFSKKNKFI